MAQKDRDLKLHLSFILRGRSLPRLTPSCPPCQLEKAPQSLNGRGWDINPSLFSRMCSALTSSFYTCLVWVGKIYFNPTMRVETGPTRLRPGASAAAFFDSNRNNGTSKPDHHCGPSVPQPLCGDTGTAQFDSWYPSTTDTHIPSFRDSYPVVQIIIINTKLHLSPSNPKYPRSSWKEAVVVSR